MSVRRWGQVPSGREQIGVSALRSRPDRPLPSASVVGRRRKCKPPLNCELTKSFATPIAPLEENPDGDVTLVEFFDYNCAYCQQVPDRLARTAGSTGGARHGLPRRLPASACLSWASDLSPGGRVSRAATRSRRELRNQQRTTEVKMTSLRLWHDALGGAMLPSSPTGAPDRNDDPEAVHESDQVTEQPEIGEQRHAEQRSALPPPSSRWRSRPRAMPS